MSAKRIPVKNEFGDELIAFVAQGPDSIGAGVVTLQIGGEFGFSKTFNAAEFSELVRQAGNAEVIAAGLKVAA